MSKGQKRLILWLIALVFIVIAVIWEMNKIERQDEVIPTPAIEDQVEYDEEVENDEESQLDDTEMAEPGSLLVPNFIADQMVSGEMAGRLSIPVIDFNMPIIVDATAANLNRAPSLMKSSHFPGNPGNAVISGHRMYEFGSHFNRLDELDIGDRIYFETNDIVHQFEVEQIMFVDPSEIWITLGDQRESRLTLFACTPIRIATHRLAVFAILKEADQ